MATINSNTVAIYVDTAGGNFTTNPGETVGATPALDAIMFSTSASISVNNATYEATAITNAGTGATVREFAVGTTSTSLSVEGVVDWSTLSQALDLDALFDAFLAKTEITAVWASTTTAATAYGGKGFLTSFELSSGIDDFATYSASFELNGDPLAVA